MSACSSAASTAMYHQLGFLAETQRPDCLKLSYRLCQATKLYIAWDSGLPENTFVVSDLAASKNACATMLNYHSSDMT